MSKRKWVVFAMVVAVLVLLDQGTKRWALESLERGMTQHAWGGALLLTLSFNRGAAFGLDLGPASRPLFILLSLVVLIWLGTVYRRTPAGSRSRAAGVTLVTGGAIGNLIDRLVSNRGVVDFLGPYDLGIMVWPIFNLADCWVVAGIALLVLSMRRGHLTTGDLKADARS